jgi:phosphoenolpyruvate-protein phosphotransferase (PTS system enzyme I)
MNIFLGISAASGIGIGTAFVIPDAVKRTIPQERLSTSDHDPQWIRFENSLKKVSAVITGQLSTLVNNKAQKEIFETYLLMLADPEFIADVQRSFYADTFNIEYVLNQKTEEYADRLRTSGNEYLAERAQDICDIFGRVLDELLDFHPFDIESIPDGSVIVATAMNPSDTIILSKRKISGLALTEGGVSSHVAILARNYGIPAVFALKKVTQQVSPGETIIIDGNTGEAIINPDDETITDYQKKISLEQRHIVALRTFRETPAKTKDGTSFTILANIGTVEEAEIAQEEGADGIGLFRTEFLFMSEVPGNSASPHTSARAFSEDVQFSAYKKVLETMSGKPVTIRTLDAGGDKLINTSQMPSASEKNPLMGLRAIRLSLAYPQQLKTQLRALYRASPYGNLHIMLPLITGIEQIKEAHDIARQVRSELTTEHIPFNPDVPIGIMIETAAAAITADCLAEVSDFFSIGTNDLTQYTIGVDRENPAVASLYNEFHLAVLRLIEQTLSAAMLADIPVSVCGEMASRQNSVLVLAGMGIRNLSMSPKQITGVKELLSRFSIRELQAISSKSLNTL